MTFDAQSKLTQIKGKDYLEVKWRIVWFREDHPLGSIDTNIVDTQNQIIKANVYDADGNLLGTGHGSPKSGVAANRPYEGAETAAIGRALAHAGYGTQFTGEEEGEHLADSPVEQSLVKEAEDLGGVSVYTAVVQAGLAQNEHSAKNALAKCKTGYNTSEKAVAWMRVYRGYRDQDLDSQSAADKANEELK